MRNCYVAAFFIVAALFSSSNYLYAGMQKVSDPLTWRMVQERAKDTVVQIFVQSGMYNWLQPFKASDNKKKFGSGFFIDSQGYIISNFHVVEEAHDVKIQIPSLGKEQLEARVVSVCPTRDLALLKLTDRAYKHVIATLGKIPFLEFGDSDKIVRTQDILALGYPLGQEKLKSTQGIVSGREIVGGDPYIQITAPLNPGNSGGPSLDCFGNVIGINTVRISSAQNIGYLYPINDAKNIIRGMYKTKFLKIPILGGEFNYGTTTMMRYLRNPFLTGLYISRVYPQSLFEFVGIQEGDVIYSINDHIIDLYGETNVIWSEDKIPLVALLNRLSIGQTIKLQICRDGEMYHKQFAFNCLNDTPIRRRYPLYEPISFEIIGGVVIMPFALNHIESFEELDYKLCRKLMKYRIRENQYESKLIVTHVFPTSQAQEARCIDLGDIITHVNGVPVATIEDMRIAMCNNIQTIDNKKFITFKTDDKKFMVLQLDRIFEDEKRLTERYSYKKSLLVESLRCSMQVL